jgi:hypothetical protein
MAITLKTETITPTQYVETIKERTVSIQVDIPASGGEPIINITREKAYYRDGVYEKNAIGKSFKITLSDLDSIGKYGLMQEIAEVIDTISVTK